ncbi:MAG: LacI family gluconate utilization system Gnt-I transcriptional repressor [Sulfitobacter sp.]|jgi:LacI family gluconate utilization system Gnt-I transcriptional repressor
MTDTIPPRRPLTLRDVSEAAGVSEMTVSRVLRNRGDVSAATRERVLETAREMGYVPNKIAGALASSRVNLVAVVIPSISNMVFPDVMAGISDALDETPLQPVVGLTSYKPEKEQKVLYEMLSWRPSGVILAGLEHTEASRAMLAASGIPVIEIMDTDGDPVDCAVGISHRGAAQVMADAIVDAGYRKIGFVGTSLGMDHRARKRFEGFVAQLGKRGLELADREFYEGGSGMAKGRELTAAMLARSPDLDFIYYSNDVVGAGGMLYCVEKGFDIPGKLGLAGFNGVDILGGQPMRLATIDSCRAEIGKLAAGLVLSRMDIAGAPEVVKLTPKLERGDTMRGRA